MKKTITISAVFVVLFLVFSMIYYKFLSPVITSDDIQIEGRIIPYDEKSFIVELNIVRLKEELEDHYLYPIAVGLGNISFIEETGYYTPSSIGTLWKSEEVLKKRTSDQVEVDIIGFTIPTKKGVYKTKFIMNKTEDFHEQWELDLYYVHVEKKFGKDLNWIEKISIKPDL